MALAASSAEDRCHPAWQARCGVNDWALAGLLGVGGTLELPVDVPAPPGGLDTTTAPPTSPLTRATRPDSPPPRV